MKGIWLENGTPRLRADLPVPEPAEGEALIRVLRAGICNTDLELVRGYYPFEGVLGHEFVGRVERGPEEWQGQRVVGEINAVCGTCRHCRENRRTHCSHRTVLGIAGRDGAFAEYLTLPVENLHLAPEKVSTDHATFVEPLAAALRIPEQVPLESRDRVLVVGDGKLGLLVAQVLASTGCRLTAVGRHADKLDILARRGIDTQLVPSKANEEAAEVPEVGAFDVAVDCTGSPAGFAVARGSLRPGGTLVMKSTYAGELTVDASSLVVDEITVVGSRCGPFEPAVELLAAGAVDVESLISARFSLDHGVRAFEQAAARRTLKVLLEIS